MNFGDGYWWWFHNKVNIVNIPELSIRSQRVGHDLAHTELCLIWLAFFPLLSESDQMKSESHSVLSDFLWLHELYSPWNSPGQNTGVGSLSLLQGILPTQGSNPGLAHCRWILYELSHKGSPRILEWVAISFSRESCQPRDQSQVSWIAGRFFTVWATREYYQTHTWGFSL